MLEKFLTEGLKSYEIVLLLLGILLFFVLLFVLIYYVVKDRPLTNVVKLFVFPVVMIGFPEYQKISFAGVVAELDTLNERLEKHPEDQNARQLVQKKLASIKDRRIARETTTVTIARAQNVVGRKDKAIETLASKVEGKRDWNEAEKLLGRLDPARLERVTAPRGERVAAPPGG